MNIEDDVTFHYITRLRRHTDELGLVVQGHLLIEFVINELIRKSFKRPSEILTDHRLYSFSVKARMLFSSGHLPDHIYDNIRRVTKIRNHLAHNLDWNGLKLDGKFNRKDEEVDGEIVVKDNKTGRLPSSRKYIKMLCLGTLTQLRNFYYEKHGSFPAPRWTSS